MAKYSYIYKGQVVRRSDHDYKYALVNHWDAVISCSSTEKGALKKKVWMLNHLNRQLEWCKKHERSHVESYEIDIANTEKWHVVKLEKMDN